MLCTLRSRERRKSTRLFLSTLFRHPNLRQLHGEFSGTGSLCVCGKIGAVDTATLGGLENMWLKAHQAPNLPTFRTPVATYEGGTLVVTAWGWKCDVSLKLVEAHNSENFYFGVRSFAVKNLREGTGGRSLLTISKCPQHWNRMLADKDKPVSLALYVLCWIITSSFFFSSLSILASLASCETVPL